MKQAEEQQQFPPPPIAQDLAGVPTPPPSEPPPPYYPPPPTSYAEYEAGLAEKDHEPRPALPPRPGNLQSHSVPSLSSTSQRGSSADSTDGKSSTSTSKSKPTFNERMYKWTTKAAGPINKLTNKLGSEAWWPTALDKECDKCARILKSFVRMSSFPCSITTPTSHFISISFGRSEETTYRTESLLTSSQAMASTPTTQHTHSPHPATR